MNEREVDVFLTENLWSIADEINEDCGNPGNSVIYSHFLHDEMEIEDIQIDDASNATVFANGIWEEGYTTMTEDGPWPDTKRDRCRFWFWVKKNEEGLLEYAFPRRKDGKIDFIEMIIEDDE